MKVIKKAKKTYSNYSLYDKSLLKNAGRSCDPARDLPCNKRSRS